MALSRYARTPILGINKYYGTSRAIQAIREGIKNRIIKTGQTVLNDGERLDSMAGKIYNDSSLWWVLAAASNVGWGLQVPPGTIILIPDLDDVNNIIG